MGRLGFEPRTNRLKAEYSTIELATLIFANRNFINLAQPSVDLQGDLEKIC